IQRAEPNLDEPVAGRHVELDALGLVALRTGGAVAVVTVGDAVAARLAGGLAGDRERAAQVAHRGLAALPEAAERALGAGLLALAPAEEAAQPVEAHSAPAAVGHDDPLGGPLDLDPQAPAFHASRVDRIVDDLEDRLGGV